jgi:hypothetical protein
MDTGRFVGKESRPWVGENCQKSDNWETYNSLLPNGMEHAE